MEKSSFLCQECGQELASPATRHTFQDCLDYKAKCHPANLERRLTAIEEAIKNMNEALEGVYFRQK